MRLSEIPVTRANTCVFLTLSLSNNIACCAIHLIIGCQLKDACVVNQLSDECLAIGEVVDVIVFELIEEGSLVAWLNNYGQDLRRIQLGWCTEEHLAKEGAQGGDWL